MAITIDWGYTKVIYVPKDFMTLVQTSPFEIRQLDLNAFRIALKDLEDSEEGMCAPHTHNHNTTVTVGGVTLARVIEILDPYTVTFENGTYAVNLVGANSNVADKTNLNDVQIRSANSAGMVQVTSGSGLSSEEHDKLMGLPEVADINTQVDDVLNIDATSELDSIPGETPSLGRMIRFLYQYFRNKRTSSNTSETMYKGDKTTPLGSSTLSDDGTTFTKDEMG